MPQSSAIDTLNPQAAGSRAVRVGPLLIIAGAGTGKTNTLAHRVAHLVLSGAKPERILLLTFTRRAALEMTRRTQDLACDAGLKPCATLHSARGTPAARIQPYRNNCGTGL